jgi:hypothetical protein
MSNPITITAERTQPAPFSLGRQMLTAGAREVLSPEDILECFRRQARCDFGELWAEDQAANAAAIAEGLRVVGVYHCGRREVFVITEADRSLTTLLLAEEY